MVRLAPPRHRASRWPPEWSRSRAEEGSDDTLRRSDRPGDDQHALHPLRPRRADRGDRPARAHADPPARRLGRARPAGDLAAHARGDRRRARQRRRASADDVAADRHHQPARDDRRVGPRERPSRSTTRSSGRTRAPTELVRELAGEQGMDRLRDRVGLPLSTYFSGPKVTWLLDHVAGRPRSARRAASSPSARSTPGCSGTSPAGPAAASTRPT